MSSQYVAWFDADGQHRASNLADMVERLVFNVPIDSIMRKELYPLLRASLADKRLREDGFPNITAVTELMHRHHSGQQRAGHLLYTILMFCQ